MKKWIVHNDYEPLGVYKAYSAEEAIERLMEDVAKGKVNVYNKNINAMIVHD